MTSDRLPYCPPTHPDHAIIEEVVYGQGVSAAHVHEGKGAPQCPYPASEPEYRAAWLDGWRDGCLDA